MTRMAWFVGMTSLALCNPAFAAGVLLPTGGDDARIEIKNHHVRVVINNGFARTEVTQQFFNPTQESLEAIYTFPIPESASLSEVTVRMGEEEIRGEVVAKEAADRIYEEEQSKGNNAAVAEKEEYRRFNIVVSPIKPQSQVELQFAYYQPLKIDTGVGRYLYPLEEGNTDEGAENFWSAHSQVEGDFTMELELKSAVPVEAFRTPGFDGDSELNRMGPGHLKLRLRRRQAELDHDFVLYYRLAQDSPGRVDLVTYRDDPQRPGTFMLVMTPGLDLEPLEAGADFIFVLDVSGSMKGRKLETLAEGVRRAIGDLDPKDRYRVITFNANAEDLTSGFVRATPGNVKATLQKIKRLRAGGGTNLFTPLRMALTRLDRDRATSLVLVTDAVVNEGVLAPAKFRKLMGRHDLRVFGFLVGNSGNWPLMRTICDYSGGFYKRVSSVDDIFAQVRLAKTKVTHESLHGVRIDLDGVKTRFDEDPMLKKIYWGQQLVMFGRYYEAGPLKLKLDASLTGEDKTYITSFDMPEIDRRHPELERMWAMSRIEATEVAMKAGLLAEDDAEPLIRNLGVEYQLVTDYTSMLVLGDGAFRRHGIDRKNARRLKTESEAARGNASQPPQNTRVDRKQPMFVHKPAHVKRRRRRRRFGGGGGGAIDPVSGTIALGLAGASWLAHRRKRSQKVRSEEEQS